MLVILFLYNYLNIKLAYLNTFFLLGNKTHFRKNGSIKTKLMFVILFLYNCLEIKLTYLNTFSTGNNTYLNKWLYRNQVNVLVIEFPYNCLKNKIHLMKYFFFFFFFAGE